MRKLIYLVATTIDGFIAGPDGSFDFFPTEGEHHAYLLKEYPETIPGHVRTATGADGPNVHFDTILMGRGTYAPALAYGITSPYPHLRQYVVTRTPPEAPDPAVTFVTGDPIATAQKLKSEPAGKDIWLCGGGNLAAQLLSEIDELVVKVNPVVIGDGIRLFANAFGAHRFVCTSSRAFEGGVIIARYRPA